MKLNNYVVGLIMFPYIYILWLFRCIIESNRSPFDFAEGESELVSGFNTEYRSGGFAIVFIAEYLRILFLRIMGAVLIRGGRGLRFFLIM
jgi:NADH-ubiquinone oxidoreductase chain 1